MASSVSKFPTFNPHYPHFLLTFFSYIVKHFGTINTGDFSNKSCWFSDSKFIGNFEVMTNSVAHDLTKKIKYSLKIISEP